MFAAIIFGTLMVVLSVGGKAFLTGMAELPIVGSCAGWYMGIVGQLPDGIVSNLIYGAMAVQVILLPLSVVLYGPGLVKRLINKRHPEQQA